MSSIYTPKQERNGQEEDHEKNKVSRADYVDKVYERLPIRWGEGQSVMADLKITQNQLHYALDALVEDGRAERTAWGDCYPIKEE